MFDAEFVVALGFAVFAGLIIYYGIHNKIAAALDKRAGRIEAELAEAARLRSEAGALLASFETRRAEAQAEAEAVVAQAHAEAERIAAEARARMVEFLQRRTKQAEEKISLAEAQAATEVRAAAADAAIKAAEAVLRAEAQGAFGEELITRGIAGLKETLQ
ncbi:MAG: ATP F0F1 synthase subunit B [Beijerinckiaceae bacterium]|nr:ATP F0F1 synthase subunit B [Beijerinckiaceae bacterium]